MTRRIVTVGVVLMMTAGMAFAGGSQEGTSTGQFAANGYGFGPGEAGVPVEDCIAEMTDESFRILAVEEGSPAAQARMEAGFIVTGIEGDIAPGETVRVSYLEAELTGRPYEIFDDNGDLEEQVKTTTVTLGDRDGEAYIGVSYQPLPGGPAARGAFAGAPRGRMMDRGGFQGRAPQGRAPQDRGKRQQIRDPQVGTGGSWL